MVAAKSPANNKPTVPIGIVLRANTKYTASAALLPNSGNAAAASGYKMAETQGGINHIILPNPINTMASKAAFLALSESFAFRKRKESFKFIMVIICLARKKTKVPTNNKP